MGWRGLARSLETAVRRSAKEADRREKIQAKLRALENASNAVESFEDHIQCLTSLHTKCSTKRFDWNSLVEEAPPTEPIRLNQNERQAQLLRDSYKPSFF